MCVCVCVCVCVAMFDDLDLLLARAELRRLLLLRPHAERPHEAEDAPPPPAHAHARHEEGDPLLNVSEAVLALCVEQMVLHAHRRKLHEAEDVEEAAAAVRTLRRAFADWGADAARALSTRPSEARVLLHRGRRAGHEAVMQAVLDAHDHVDARHVHMLCLTALRASCELARLERERLDAITQVVQARVDGAVPDARLAGLPWRDRVRPSSLGLAPPAPPPPRLRGVRAVTAEAYWRAVDEQVLAWRMPPPPHSGPPWPLPEADRQRLDPLATWTVLAANRGAANRGAAPPSPSGDEDADAERILLAAANVLEDREDPARAAREEDELYRTHAVPPGASALSRYRRVLGRAQPARRGPSGACFRMLLPTSALRPSLSSAAFCPGCQGSLGDAAPVHCACGEELAFCSELCRDACLATGEHDCRGTARAAEALADRLGAVLALLAGPGILLPAQPGTALGVVLPPLWAPDLSLEDRVRLARHRRAVQTVYHARGLAPAPEQ